MYANHASGTNTVVYNNEQYRLLQFHAHTPSENTVNGVAYDMEVHFVHANSDLELTVIGLFIETPDDDSDCTFLEQLLDELPEDEEGVEVDITEFVRFDDDTDYFTFAGSLTTPPCTEGVNWIVRAEPLRCSESQVDAFRDVLSTSSRPTQPRNSREILFGSANTQSNDDDDSDDDNSNIAYYFDDDDDTSTSNNDDDDDNNNDNDDDGNDDDDSSSSGASQVMATFSLLAAAVLAPML